MRILKPYNPYTHDTTQQKGSGMTVYVGRRTQRGHGLGNIFGSLLRTVTPLIKRAVVPALKNVALRGAKHVGRRVARSGLRVASDVLAGKKPSQALKTRARQTGSDLLKEARQHFIGGARRTPKRKRPRRRVVSKKQRKISKDIFT